MTQITPNFVVTDQFGNVVFQFPGNIVTTGVDLTEGIAPQSNADQRIRWLEPGTGTEREKIYGISNAGLHYLQVSAFSGIPAGADPILHRSDGQSSFLFPPNCKLYANDSNALLSLNGVYQYVPNAAVTISIAGSQTCALVTATFDFENFATNGVCVGVLEVAGIGDFGEQCIFKGSNCRATVSQQWLWQPGLAPGNYTLRLKAYNTAGAAVANCNTAHTGIRVMLLDFA